MAEQKRFHGAMTIDVEDYYHVHAFKDVIAREQWPTMERRVESNTNRLLDMFAEHDTRATFFVLGVVAYEFPNLVRRIVDEGHELASHGWAHHAVFEQSANDFYRDVAQTRLFLEDISGHPVKGYRAPSFSINAQTPWAYRLLAKAGYKYSSSAHPIAHDTYGDPNGFRGAFREHETGLIEIPVTTAEVLGKRLPAAGGGFFRLFPLPWFDHAFREANTDGMPVNFYLHPWEIDPSQPRIKDAPLKSRLRHYIGLSRCEQKLGALLRRGRWTSIDEAYDGWFDRNTRAERSAA